MALKWKYVTSYTVQTFQGEMKNPQQEEHGKDVKNPEAVRHKEINVLDMLDPNGSESLTVSLHKYFHL